ncbi:hypothetical protein [Burkholderia ubonensis]|uniref:hypothetical protein n=1 Tax=Burkholderia ubonensis TaxID=101571 RepID=UPI0012FA74BA|nr:hypothetical protein [Burkholderia ubonensis]
MATPVDFVLLVQKRPDGRSSATQRERPARWHSEITDYVLNDTFDSIDSAIRVVSAVWAIFDFPKRVSP